jgi:hypothetical protein
MRKIDTIFAVISNIEIPRLRLSQKSKHRVIPAKAGISCQSLIINNQQFSINDLQGIAGQARNDGTFETTSKGRGGF